MKLTPLEIRKQEFKKALRGLDAQEVQVFLDMVADHYGELLEENKSLDRKIIELETKLKDFQQNEKNLRETLLNVQEVKKQSEESSRRQADLIIKDAELKALEIMEGARKEARQVKEEVSWLKAQKESFINRIRHILSSQIELLSVMEIDDIIPPEAASDIKKLKGGRRIEQKEQEHFPRKKVTKKPDEAIDAGSSKLTEQQTSEEDTGKQSPKREIESYLDEDNPRKNINIPPVKADHSLNRPLLTEDDINDFFKKGIQIDDLIKTINKKESDK